MNHLNTQQDPEKHESKRSPSDQFLLDMALFQNLADDEKVVFLRDYDAARGYPGEPDSISLGENDIAPRQVYDGLAVSALKSTIEQPTQDTEATEKNEINRRHELIEFLKTESIAIDRLPLSVELWSHKPPTPGSSLGNQTITRNNALKRTAQQPDNFVLGTTARREEGANAEYARELSRSGVSEVVSTMPAVWTSNRLVEEQVQEKLAFGRTRTVTVEQRKNVTEARTMGDYVGTNDTTPAWLVGYQAYTMTGLVNSKNRVGEPYIVQIALPEQQAHSLSAWLMEDPIRARELADYTIVEVLGIPKSDSAGVSYSHKIKAIRFTEDPRNPVQEKELLPIVTK